MNVKYKFSAKVIFEIILILLTTIIIVVSIVFINLQNKLNKVYIDKEKFLIDDKDNQEKSQSEYIKNIVLLGIDSSSYNIGRSDCIMIATIDTKHDNIKLTSIIRDSYVSIPGKNVNDKINHAYAFGGPELTLQTLNQNFNLNITDFISLNLSSFPKIIDDIGGVTLNITDDELKYINKYIQSLNKLNTTSSPYISSSGIQTLDGTQALAYLRIRYTDGGDFERSHRQRVVIEAIFQKMKNFPINKDYEILNLLLPNVDTNLTPSEIVSTCFDLSLMHNKNIIEERFPKDEDGEGKLLNGIYYYTFDKDSTIDKIHTFIYGS